MWKGKIMGLSASQARLLSITARISDNELHSQQIANSKVRLADKTQEASKEYVQALDSQKLVFTTYDAKGNATQVNLTPALLYDYSTIKNQYGISNNVGQLLVSSEYALKFKESSNVYEFVQKFGVELVDNPDYEFNLTTIYGDKYENYFDTINGQSKVNFGGVNILEWLSQPNSSWAGTQYTTWRNTLSDITNSLDGEEKGFYKELISELMNIPNPGDEPIWQDLEFPDFASLAGSYNASACHDSVGASANGIYHMEHNLCNLIWGLFGDGQQGLGVDEEGTRISIRNSAGTINITPDFKGDENSLTNSFNQTKTGEAAAKNLLNALRNTADYNSVQKLMQNIIDTYCDVVNYLYSKDLKGVRSECNLTGGASVKSEAQLKSQWDKIYTDLANLQNDAREDYNKKNEEAYYAYQKAHEQWEKTCTNVLYYTKQCANTYNKYTNYLANLSEPKITSDTDPKAKWYENLWHRLNGSSNYKDSTAEGDGTQGKYYKVLENSLYKSQSWMQYALEQGLITLEQVQYSEDVDDATGLKTSKWESKEYATCVDIQFVDDETAIARAEAIYTRKLNEIEAQDKKFDNEIKKLDTEHTALQTEYESVKSVVDKNVERSFKAFS